MTHAVDTNNRRTMTTHTEQVAGGAAVATKRAQFGYFDNGQIETIDRFNVVAPGGTSFATTTYTYFDDNTVETIVHTNATPATIADYSYTYYPDGDMHTMTTPDGDIDLTLDATGQVTDADFNGAQADETYTYDDNGNRLTANGSTYTPGAGNRITSDGTYVYEYDDNGNRTLRYIDVDTSGTLNTGDTDITEYDWDYRNRLVEVTDRDTPTGDATQTVGFVYDAFNNRISKIVDADGAGAGTAVRTNFALLGAEVYLEFSGSTLTHRYMPGTTIDMNLAIEDVAAADVLWSLTDHQGTVRDVIDDTGAVQNHLQYTSFGAIASESDDTVDYRFTYTGREHDAETGLYYYRARYYDAANGVFISTDPIAFEAGDANLYRYVSNSPMMGTDPTGEAGETTKVLSGEVTNKTGTEGWKILSEKSTLIPGVKPIYGYYWSLSVSGPQGGYSECGPSNNKWAITFHLRVKVAFRERATYNERDIYSYNLAVKFADRYLPSLKRSRAEEKRLSDVIVRIQKESNLGHKRLQRLRDHVEDLLASMEDNVRRAVKKEIAVTVVSGVPGSLEDWFVDEAMDIVASQ